MSAAVAPPMSDENLFKIEMAIRELNNRLDRPFGVPEGEATEDDELFNLEQLAARSGKTVAQLLATAESN